MSERFSALRTRLLILLLIELVVLVLVHVFINPYLYLAQYFFLLVNIVVIFVVFYNAYVQSRERVTTVSRILGEDAHAAFEFGRILLLTYEDDYTISWVGEEFGDEMIGQPLEHVFPSLMELVKGSAVSKYIKYNDRTYEVASLGHDNVLFFKDTSEYYDLMENSKNNRVVLGIAHLDNYEETTQYEEEQTIAYIDSNIRQAVVRWADEHQMYVRRLRGDRYLLVLNERNFTQVEEERFNIVHTVRKQSRQVDTNITLSLAFARNSSNLKELEDMCNRALEIAQGRGGDQVVVNTKDEEMRYYGGRTEAVEKRSKVRVRVTAQTLGDLINQSSNILVVGHKIMDFDCFASALAVSAIASVYKKEVNIVMEYGDVDSYLGKAFEENHEMLAKRHHFINRSQAESIINDDTLLIMVDHHSISQTQFEDLPKRVKNIVIIDHHRRTGEFHFKPTLVYIESSASSACELLVELLPYQRQNVHLTKLEATYMYTGMLVDTNRFRNRSGSRTFEAAAELRKFGADLEGADDMLRDVYQNFELKNQVLSKSELFDEVCVLVPYKDGDVTRTLMSQVADEILQVRDVEASFVIATVGDDVVAVSARSKAELNVQLIMERLGGGGHFTGAAAQIRSKSVNEVVEELKAAILEVRKELE